MKRWFRKAIIFAITISFIFNLGLGEIISYAQDVDMQGIYQSVVSDFNLASVAESEGVSTLAESTASEDFEYTDVDGGVSITKYTGSDTDVVIPSTIGGKDVKTIGQAAFAGSKTLVSVVIPDGVTEIGQYAFSACSKLKSVTMSNTLIKIGDYSFNECTNLVGIGIPSSVTTIGNRAFTGCTRLRNVELPSNLETLGEYAFYDCDILGVTVPDTIKTIGANVFTGCDNLYTAVLPEGLTSIPYGMFSSCPKLEQVNIPSTVKSIGQSAFSGCYNLKEIYLPDELEKIGNFAFYVCTSLETIDIPKTVTSIGPGAFSNCTSLDNVVLPQGLTELGTEAFRYCKSLTSIVVPKNITHIYSDTFQGCESLTSVKLYQGVTNIGGNAFQGCTNLKEIYMPKTIVKIGDSSVDTAFDDCTNLTMYVYRDSVSETYAIDYSIPYEYIDDAAFETRIQIEKDSYEFYTSSTSGIDVNFFSRTISTDEITWTSSDESVAKINSATNYINESSDTYDTTINLQIKTFDKTGNCTITGETSDGITVTCKVRVLNPYEETVDDDPIIVLPGVMGSRLFSTSALDYDKSSVIWDPQVGGDDILGSADSLVSLSNDLLGKVYVKPPQNQKLLKEHENSFGIEYREYGALNTYKNLIDTLCDSTDRPVYFFSYNWMESNSDNADKLREFINELDVDKVDLVCHSMGGIVASSYMSKYKSEDKVDKIVTCGTPYEGAPGIINKMQNWDILADNDDFIFTDTTIKEVTEDALLGLIGGLTKQTKTKITTAAELVPSENYVSRVAMYKKGIPFKEEISFDEYKTICKNIFKEKYDDGLIFQESLKGSTGYNNLLDYDKAYFLIGTNQKTITSIVFNQSDDVSDILYEDDLKYETKGDGTVPYISSTMSYAVKRLPEDRYCFADGNHTQIVKKAKTIEWIKEKLEITSGASTLADDQILSQESQGSDYMVLRVACPVDVNVESNGEVLDSSASGFDISSSFGRLDIIGQNDEIKMLCLDKSDDYDVTLDGTAEGTMDYTVRYYDSDDELQSETTIEDVPVTKDTIIKTKPVSTEDTVLEVDSDGDGTVDKEYTVPKGESVVAPKTVKFNPDNGDKAIEKTVDSEAKLNYTPEEPTKEGYTFVGWYEDTDDTTTAYKSGATYTKDVTYKAKWAHVKMLGAQVKKVVDDKSGIRFGTKIYNDGDEIIEKGTIILPKNLLDDGEILTLDTAQIAKSVGKVNYETNQKENYVIYLGTLVNISREQFDRQITASSYVIYKDKAGNKYTVYSQYPNGSKSVNDLLNK